MQGHPLATQSQARPRQATLSLEQVLDIWESQYGVNFAYERRLLTDKTVAPPESTSEEDLESLLRRVLPPLQLTFIKVDNVYVIRSASRRNVPMRKVVTRPPGQMGTSTPPGTTTTPGAVSTQFTQPIEQAITGQVTDASTGEALPGVNIVVKGTAVGTVTDVDGNYRLTASDNAEVLVFSSVGYTSEEVAIGDRTVINLAMAPDIQSLSEVVVVGYGEVKKSDLTGSVSSISQKEITALPVNNVQQIMQGRAPSCRLFRILTRREAA